MSTARCPAPCTLELRLVRGEHRARARTASLLPSTERGTWRTGIRLLLLNIATFVVFARLSLPRYGGIINGNQASFGLYKSYSEMLDLHKAEEVTTIDGMRLYLHDLAENTQSMQVLSDRYFQQEQGDVRIVTGISDYGMAPKTIFQTNVRRTAHHLSQRALRPALQADARPSVRRARRFDRGSTRSPSRSPHGSRRGP